MTAEEIIADALDQYLSTVEPGEEDTQDMANAVLVALRMKGMNVG